MAHGALSWLGPLAAGALAGVASPARGGLQLGGGVLCYRPYACADGDVSLGALEPKFWVAFCRGVGREDLIERQFDAAGTPAHTEVEAILAGRTRAQWADFAREVDCCLEPVVDLDEALRSDVVRSRPGMVVEVRQPGIEAPLEVLGSPLVLSATPADVHRRPAPALGEHTAEILTEAGLTVPTPQETSTP
jgi:crotonobetainyl-CoA:carnitine CoA-transferase CaiB-like acyl-CoA transferase